MSKAPFLLEIGLEEMPARFVTGAMQQLQERVEEFLQQEQLGYESIEAYSTPRRLAVIVKGLDTKQADVVEEARGPSKEIALDEDGEWSKAAIGFSKGKGASLDDLEIKETENGEYVFVRVEKKGKDTAVLLQQMQDVITSMTFPKNMRWGHYSLRFVRPIHWIAAIFADSVIPFEITDVKTSRQSYGHRFLGTAVEITDVEAYRETLLQEHVLAHPEERKKAIVQQINMIEEEQGWQVPMDDELLEEVNNLVEYPTALFGQYEESFLELPKDVLITSMKEHQRYFPVEDKNGTLLPYFVTVRNGDHEHLENVQKGNEKVLTARLQDAMFFYQEDLKLNIDETTNKLDHIVYHEELGSVGDKVRRIQTLAKSYADAFQADEKEQEVAQRTAAIAKFDLVTYMVDEFSELQGRMGEVYALKAGEAEEVAIAINEHYMPRSAGDTPAQSRAGAIVSVADKMDTIVTSFSIGLKPTGSQDPYALRRQAAGIVQTLLFHEVPADLGDLVSEAIQIAKTNGIEIADAANLQEEIEEFFRMRIKNQLLDTGIRYDVIDSILAKKIKRVDVLQAAAQFLNEKANDPAFKRTVEALSRVTNIAKNTALEEAVISRDLFEQNEEIVLYESYLQVQAELPAAMKRSDIASAYLTLEQLVPVIDNYFEEIMVMSDNEALKNNRLALMAHLSVLIQSFADFRKLVLTST
ncbi:glycine--tRNA ligase subunit beta [Salsuginibacillus kocurii]|uniref:glycine--tRNA ligase subunit beta n=1 Tax=Salsuginibacillus kocurii TaxID=427078 RepID=UPI000372835A|nr:glycine--tRNA ligase subunit beta [Salsuginibacillus kocurii]